MINPGIVPRSRGDLCDFCETADKNLYIDMLSVHMGVMLMREYKSPRKGQISILHPWLCTCQNRFWKSKNPDKIGVCSDNIFFVVLIWWTRRDSNPRSLRCERKEKPSIFNGCCRWCNSGCNMYDYSFKYRSNILKQGMYDPALITI